LITLLARSFGDQLQPADEILLSQLEHHGNLAWQRLAERRRIVLRVLTMTQDGTSVSTGWTRS
jgi:selenocysteine lyase/cysteine desulfurase